MSHPKTAYILLWFPKASETFIFREVVNLRNMGVELKVFSVYGELFKGLSPEMLAAAAQVERLGLPYIRQLPQTIWYWWKRDRRLVKKVLRTMVSVPWRGLEKSGENLWAVLCGFHLARRFEEEGIELIHSPWANGPATAAWVASMLTGIPFGFTARAWDIYPHDGMLAEKIKDSLFVRTNTRRNAGYLRNFANGHFDKVHMIYNGLTMTRVQEAAVPMVSPYKLLAVGRFSFTKGFDVLLKACRILKNEGLDFHLTLAGDGLLNRPLKFLARCLGLTDRVSFPGFVSHDRISDLMFQSDVLVMPSVISWTGDRDGIPNVILEALTHRLPVVASDISGISEIIIDRVTGRLVPQRNPETLARAIKDVLQDRQTALRMAECGRALVGQEFDPQNNFHRVLNLYEQSCNGLTNRSIRYLPVPVITPKSQGANLTREILGLPALSNN